MLRYAITEGRLKSGCAPLELEEVARRCAVLADGGVEYLLVREKQLTERELYLLTRSILQEVAVSAMKVLVAGSLQVARAAAADGFHTGSQYGWICGARRTLVEGWISCSCHSVMDVVAAREAGADLCLFGPVFGKTVDAVQVVPGLGLEALRQACAAAGRALPVFALGGVTESNAGVCVAAGASGVAGIRMFFAEQGGLSTPGS